ncbi:MAG: hypothetical protein V3V99_00040 [candidate division Zixibacteria bacterium]
MMRPNKKAGFYINVTCPGCGADLELQDDFFSIECSFCGSVLRLVMPESTSVYYVPMKIQKRELRFQVDRYLKNAGLPLTGPGLSYKVVYYPYWKIDAVKLKVKAKRTESYTGNTNSNILTTQLDYRGVFVTGRVIGKSLTAKPSSLDEKKLTVQLSPFSTTWAATTEISGIPPSLGRRTDYIKMYPKSAEDHDDSAQYIPIEKSWEATVKQASDSVEMSKHTGEPGRCVACELMFPEGSIVYFPFGIFEHISRGSPQRIVCDGVVGRVLSVVNPSDEPTDEHQGQTSLIDYGQVSVTMHRCKNCGIDLPASSSCVYICRNCHIAVSIDNNVTLNEGIFQAIESGNIGNRNTQLFPFWSFRAPVNLINDFVKSYYHTDNSENLIVPAFTFSNFDAMRRLTKRVTASGQTLNIEPVDDLDRRFLPATVGLQKAHRIAEITLYCSHAANKTNLSIDDFKFSIENSRLIYIPFSCENYFYVSTVNDVITFEKRAYRPMT